MYKKIIAGICTPTRLFIKDLFSLLNIDWKLSKADSTIYTVPQWVFWNFVFWILFLFYLSWASCYLHCWLKLSAGPCLAGLLYVGDIPVALGEEMFFPFLTCIWFIRKQNERGDSLHIHKENTVVNHNDSFVQLVRVLKKKLPQSSQETVVRFNYYWPTDIIIKNKILKWNNI